MDIGRAISGLLYRGCWGLLAAIVSFAALAFDGRAASHTVTYAVTGQEVAVVSAVTPYDAEPEVRNVFLHWFKRGFDTVRAGHPPLMIEWDASPKGRSAQQGYELGMDAAEKDKKNAPGPSLRTIAIPPY